MTLNYEPPDEAGTERDAMINNDGLLDNDVGLPYVAIGAGERAPWADEPLTCPLCGAGPLPLEQSEPPGLTSISHCGHTWLRGEPDVDRIFDRPQP